MSILKNILGAFVEFKEKDINTSSSKQGSTEKDKVIETANEGHNTVTSPASTNIQAGEKLSPADQYQKYFENLIEEANNKNPIFQGTDFKEFIDSKSDVEAISDEATRYRTAFNVLKRTGLTKDKLVTTGKEYLNLIDRDIKAFENAYLEHYKTQVVGKEQQLQQKAQELQALTQKIEILQNEMKQLNQEVLQSKDRLNSNKSSFNLAGENIKKAIEKELKKIDEYFS